MVELRVTLAVEIAREFGCEDPSYRIFFSVFTLEALQYSIRSHF